MKITKRADQCPLLGPISTFRCDPETGRMRGMVDIEQARTNEAQFVSYAPWQGERYDDLPALNLGLSCSGRVLVS